MPNAPLTAAFVVLGTLLSAAAPPAWRAPDPENLLVIDTTRGRIVVEMRPDFAPRAVERVRRLARDGTYDGLLFHRVIDGFVDQTGNPNNHDGGVSSYPDLPPEFTFRLEPGRLATVRAASDTREGFVGASPVASVSDREAARGTDGRRRAWGAYCAGTAGMGRQADPGTANSEIFFMRDSSRRLDGQYAVWGQTISGLEVVRAMAVGEPPSAPDRMLKVRVAADLPPDQRPRLQVMDAGAPAFVRRVQAIRKARGADFSLCDVTVPVRTAP